MVVLLDLDFTGISSRATLVSMCVTILFATEIFRESVKRIKLKSIMRLERGRMELTNTKYLKPYKSLEEQDLE